jgi:hypothetical protein
MSWHHFAKTKNDKDRHVRGHGKKISMGQNQAEIGTQKLLEPMLKNFLWS